MILDNKLSIKMSKMILCIRDAEDTQADHLRGLPSTIRWVPDLRYMRGTPAFLSLCLSPLSLVRA